ncbi:acylphosphatase [Oceanobacillus sp. ISL-74]|uniref:acylphosphatase n=1 Tax=Oceanobacillus sp. ISL-74 TaxID=2819162 RepID=UPI001BE6266D|nr:acylphosphatase [Oceanobacillus sp. ISL-74]MBT2599385.1 acylphosphatase [Oceanobacillus sp. ISL-74]
MNENNTEWLSHLSEEIVADAHGNLLDAYVIALEGWRRGLKLRWHVKDSEKFSEMRTWFVDRPGQLFSLSSDQKTHYFFRTRGDKVSNEAVDIGKDKEKTKKILSEDGVRVPNGRQFTKEKTNQEIIEFAGQIGYPIVIKPTDGSFGRGVISNISSSGELAYSLDYLRNELGYEDIILEQFIPGNDYRLYVVGNKVVAAMHRMPPNVIGDGVNTVRALIDIKNDERKLNPRLVSCLIKADNECIDYIGRHGYTLESVPDNGEQVFLNSKGNISLGGDPIDVFDELPQHIKDYAVKAVQAVPGLHHGAVDMIFDPNTNESYIIELNPTSQLGGLLYPIQGKSRDIPNAIIDYYFPETISEKEKTNTFFDFHDVLDPLQNRDAVVTTVTPCPQDKIYMKKYIATGNVQELGYHRGLRKHAFERFLHGYIMRMDNGDIEVVIGGTDPEMVDDFKHAFWEDEERAQVIEVREEPYDEPLKVGFEIKTDLKTQLEELQMYKQELEATEKALKKAELERRKYYESFSWKATTPVRAVGSMFKKLRK